MNTASANSRTQPDGLLEVSKYQWLVLTTCLTTFVLIIIGGIVRTTGSGDACPDWPRCHGQLLPPLETKVLIEFSHRLMASVVGFLVLAVAIAGWRSQRGPILRWGGVFAGGLVIAQIILGGATVLSDLSANVVMAHLALASTLLAALIVLALVSMAQQSGSPSSDAEGFRNLAFVAAIAVFAVMMSGSYVSGSGAGLVFRDWPLFDGSLNPGVGRLAVIQAMHRAVVLALGVMLWYLALRAWRASFENPVLRYGPLFALVVYVTQGLVGAANIWTLLQPSAAAAHLALAELLWAMLVMIAGVAQLSSAPAARGVLMEREPPAAQLRAHATFGKPS